LSTWGIHLIFNIRVGAAICNLNVQKHSVILLVAITSLKGAVP